MSGNNPPSGQHPRDDQYPRDHDKDRQKQEHGPQSPGHDKDGKKPDPETQHPGRMGKDNPGNFANDPDRARKPGEKDSRS